MYQKEELMVSSIKKNPHVFIPFMKLFLYMDPESNLVRVYVEQYLYLLQCLLHT